ncbi:cation transporter, partial [bacterium]|nr:cation transporter [bacterium]
MSTHGAHDNHDEAGHVHAQSEGIRGFISSIVRPHSHDSSDSVDDALAGSAEGIKAVKLSLLGLGVTAALQVVIVAVTGSVALLADTIHNFGDAITAVPLWIAFALTGRVASRRYTYGYGRAEDLAGVFVVLMIAASAVLAGYESVSRLVDPRPIHNLGLVALAGFLGFIGNEAVAQYRIRVGKRIGSAALIADGYHARTDGFTSIAVVFGAAGVWLGIKQADPIVGLAITLAILFVLKSAVSQMWRRLMDAVEPEILHQAEEAAAGVPGVVDVSLVRPRWIGHTIHAEARVTVDRELSVADGHRIAEQVEHAMVHAVPKLTTVIVHVDPCGHDGSTAYGVDHHKAHLSAHSH